MKVLVHDRLEAVGASAWDALVASVTVEERCPVLALPSSWEAYLASLSGKHRHELMRKTRRLERDAPEARVSSARAPGEIEARIGEFLDLHRRSRTGKARFMDEPMERLFRRVLIAFSEREAGRLLFLDTPAGPLRPLLATQGGGE